MDNDQLIVVKISALPDMIPKTLEVKRLLARGEEKNSAQACRRVGISRSAYYKYRDSVFSYEEMFLQKIVTLYCVLRDEPGVLSRLLAKLHEQDANILTVNQNIPVDGAAAVTISMRLGSKSANAVAVVSSALSVSGVAEAKLLAGE